MSAAPPGDPVSVLRIALPGLHGAGILDVGCGSGALASALVREGAAVTGVDPNPAALEAARRLVPEATFRQARAEALPFEAAVFDAVVFLNSLHHVPVPAMDAALDEARRVLRPGAPLVVLEPLAEGNCFAAVRVIEDETEVRAAAQAALARAIAEGRLIHRRTLGYVRRERFADAAAVAARAAAVDPARAEIVARDRARIFAAIEAAGERMPDGELCFDQPIRADVLAAPQAA
jgi:ubiquinone/menaquinone biosynthesis C-methylase UbiE